MSWVAATRLSRPATSGREQPLEVGQRLDIAGQTGIVRTVEPILGERELRLVVQLRREPGAALPGRAA
jgi:hypothetical protein